MTNNNMEGVPAYKKSYVFQAYVYESMAAGQVRVGPYCKTREEAEAHRAAFTGPGKTWVEEVPARYSWREGVQAE